MSARRWGESVVVPLLVMALWGSSARAAPAGPPIAGRSSPPVPAEPTDRVRIKEVAHIDGVRDNPLVGFGLVVGLAGTGDTARSGPTVQSIANTLTRFGVRVLSDQISSRNVAAVMVTATLPPFATPGQKIDINVASLGDARSLLGGTLMLAPLRGPDDQTYALAQGPLSVGGFRYDAFGNLVQKNHSTVGQVPSGAILEAAVASRIVSTAGNLVLVLDSPDYTTAARTADAVNSVLAPLEGGSMIRAQAVDAARVAVRLTEDERVRLVDTVRQIENATLVPDQLARVVVNERTGTVVSGGKVRLGEVSVSHGELKVSISTDYLVSQPRVFGRVGSGIGTAVVPSTQIDVDEGSHPAISLPAGASIDDLISALDGIHVPPRDMISILQALHRAGALRAELIIQ